MTVAIAWQGQVRSAGSCSETLSSYLARIQVSGAMATATGTTSSAGSSSAEAEALKLALEYLVNSMDTSSLLPAALSRGLIREKQKADCVSESNPYQKSEKFLEHLQREVNGDNKKFHTFVQLLVDTGQSNLASRLSG